MTGSLKNKTIQGSEWVKSSSGPNDVKAAALLGAEMDHTWLLGPEVRQSACIEKVRERFII